MAMLFLVMIAVTFFVAFSAFGVWFLANTFTTHHYLMRMRRAWTEHDRKSAFIAYIRAQARKTCLFTDDSVMEAFESYCYEYDQRYVEHIQQEPSHSTSKLYAYIIAHRPALRRIALW